MLVEAFKYLTTPCPKPFRAMGYLSELIATEARYRRCHPHWQPHLDNTAAVIKEAIAACTSHRKAVVLGAGVLSDIPIKELSEAFETVELIDVAFLRSTRNRLRAYSNVECREADITDVSEALYQSGTLPSPGIPTAISLQDTDLVVSANVLSQLPLTPACYARKRNPTISDAEAETCARAMIEAHLALLKTCRGTRCLITEVERLHVCDTEVLAKEDPLFGVSVDLDGAEWLWDIAPSPEISRDFSVRNRVKAAYWRGREVK